MLKSASIRAPAIAAGSGATDSAPKAKQMKVFDAPARITMGVKNPVSASPGHNGTAPPQAAGKNDYCAGVLRRSYTRFFHLQLQ